jgi:NTE family protein
MNKSKVGLVLSGGGAKGAYQVGILKCMAEAGLNIDAVAGASIGALNGAVIASADNINQASEHLQCLWQTLANESPLKANKLFVASYLGYLCLMGTSHLSPVLSMAKAFLKQKNIIDLGLLDNSPVKKLVDCYITPEKLQEGLPLYVSIFESKDSMDTAINTAMGILGIADTAPSEFRHVQALPSDKQRDIILASACLPIVFASQKIDGKHYVDGGIGGWRKAQGNTPITPLITMAHCTHVIVTHLSEGSLWNRHDFPETTILEIRPRKPITQESMLQDLLNFKADKINYWIEQGYEDASRCLNDVFNVLKLQAASQAAQAVRDSAIAQLDDSFHVF